MNARGVTCRAIPAGVLSLRPRLMKQAATATMAAMLLVSCHPPCIKAAHCPTYEAIANTENPLIANFSMETFLGHWVEVRSRNVPGLTTGCSCTRYNCESRRTIVLHAGDVGSVPHWRVVIVLLAPAVADTGDAAAWVEHFSCCREFGANLWPRCVRPDSYAAAPARATALILTVTHSLLTSAVYSASEIHVCVAVCSVAHPTPHSLTTFQSKGSPGNGTSWPGKMQASVDGLPEAGYWILDLEAAEGHPYGYGWIYACTEALGVIEEFVYFFSRTTSIPSTLEDAWLARAKRLGISTIGMREIPQPETCIWPFEGF
jgi:hypothetical protein